MTTLTTIALVLLAWVTVTFVIVAATAFATGGTYPSAPRKNTADRYEVAA